MKEVAYRGYASCEIWIMMDIYIYNLL